MLLPLLCIVMLRQVSGQNAAVAATPVGPDEPPAQPHLLAAFKRAVVEMQPGMFNVTGALLVVQSELGLFFTGLLFGLRPGSHAMHVHEFGRLGNKCADAGGHFNPDGTTGHPAGHGGHAAAGHAGHVHGTTPSGRHAGDLGTVVTPVRGPTLVYRYDEKLRLGGGGKYDVAGLTVIVHENVPGEPRAACGIIRCLNC